MNNHLKEIEIPKKLDQKIEAGVRMHKVKRRKNPPSYLSQRLLY
ncbi:hypothetical protein [Kurthia zopfii]|nr:hypothetical protein [Kurthia zopfii]